MRIVILSRDAESHSTRRLVQAARKRGHDVRVRDTMRFSLSIEGEGAQLYYDDEPFGAPDVVIPRIGSSVTFYGCAVVRQFEAMGVSALNSAQAINVSRDKLRAFQALSRHAIRLPETYFVRSREAIIPTIQRLGGAPVVIKLIEGTQGVGVILAESLNAAQAIVETLQVARQHVLVQRFISESRGRDVRALVVGGKVVAAMRRVALGDEFRSNIHRGGRAEKVELDEEYTRCALRATKAMGLRVAGVDMLESEDGPLVMEVNSSPGLEGIERVTKVDVAGAIVTYTEDLAEFPEVDVTQRMSMGEGYGVSEFVVANGGEFDKKTMAELALDDRDIRVLSVERSTLVTPNPRSDFEFLAGDRVFAYGNLLVLRELAREANVAQRKAPKATA